MKGKKRNGNNRNFVRQVFLKNDEKQNCERFFFEVNSIINRENKFFVISPILQRFRIRRFGGYFSPIG